MTVFGGDETMANDVNSPKVRLVQQAAGVQTINTTDTTLTFGSGSEDFDTNGWHDESTNNSRITVDRDGFVRIHGVVVVANNTTVTALMLTVARNGVVQAGIGRHKPAANNLSHSAEVTALLECSAGDYFELIATAAGASVATISSGRFASVFELEFAP
jgi:hypothetical protein